MLRVSTRTGKNRDDEAKVYNRVRVLRQERGISREEMAEALGVNHRTVGYIEREQYEPLLSLAWRISDFFGLPMEAVFSREPFRLLSEEVYGRRGSAGGTRGAE